MDKQKQLHNLRKEVEKSELYKEKFIGKMVFGEGNVDAEVMFVGEAPGKQEAATGRPFIGRSGKLLRSFIRKIGLDENEVYITSPVKYLPKHGTPTKVEIRDARKDFLKQVEIIDPKIIVLLGKTAMYAVLEEDISILKHHGETREQDGKTYFLTLHPAAVLRFPKYSELLEHDFKKLRQLLQ